MSPIALTDAFDVLVVAGLFALVWLGHAAAERLGEVRRERAAGPREQEAGGGVGWDDPEEDGL